jgi:flavin reductase (DIM6/NTAB) family NADH-FMN oxidoreductase RutF
MDPGTSRRRLIRRPGVAYASTTDRMIDADTFRAVLGRFASGVTIVTARDDAGRDHGMTVSAFCSLSLDPPQVLFCVDHTASMHELLLGHPRFGISILSSGQEAYSRRFADRDSDRSERFDGIAYRRGDAGVVLLDEALAHLECQIRRHHDSGDHTIFIAEVERAEALDGRPLLYFRGGYALLER